MTRVKQPTKPFLLTLAKRKRRLLASLLAGAAGLATTYASQSAQACDCMQPSVAQAFGGRDHVFVGQVLFSLELPDTMLYLSSVERNYTGCEAEQGVIWVQTPQDWASCGTRFSVGESYLFFADDAPGLFSFAAQTDACLGNRRKSELSAAELAYLETRQSCCGGSCACQPGVEEAECEQDPCSLALPCEVPGSVRCEANNCGGCHAEFYDTSGTRVCMGGPQDPRCVDHKDYEFGDCEAYPGWLVLDGECQEVTSGCGTLPGQMPIFESQQACQSACEPDSDFFACGDELSCDRTKSYCEIGTSGPQPPPGESPFIYSCRPLPEACVDAPTCKGCFEPVNPENGSEWVILQEGLEGSCTDDGAGRVTTRVDFP